MRLWKFGIAVSVVLIGTGVIGTGQALGEIYKAVQTTKVVEIEQVLDIATLQKVSIDADADIRIVHTTGEPKAVFLGEVSGVYPQTAFRLDVRSEGDTTYIELRNEQRFDLSQFDFWLNKKEIVLYLPEEGIERLEIEGGFGRTFEYSGTIGVDELVVDQGYVTIQGESSLRYLEVDSYYGTIQIDNHIPAEVVIENMTGDIDLTGQYASIDMEDIYRSDIHIASDTPYQVALKVNETGVELLGQVDTVDIKADDIEHWDIYDDGYWDRRWDAHWNGYAYHEKRYNQYIDFGDIEIKANNQPTKIEIDSYGSDIMITLPESLSGLRGTYEHDDEEALDTNFAIQITDRRDDEQYLQYGDEAMMLDITQVFGKTIITK